MFSSAEWWWGEEGANAAGDVVELSAQPNRRLLPPLGWANVIGETTSIITIVVANIVKNDLLGIPSFRRLIGSFARLFCWYDYKVSLLIDWRGRRWATETVLIVSEERAEEKFFRLRVRIIFRYFILANPIQHWHILKLWRVHQVEDRTTIHSYHSIK